jgi:hypothetical protein
MYSRDFTAPMPQAAATVTVTAAHSEEPTRLPLWLTYTEIEFLMGLCLVAPRSSGDGPDATLLRHLADAWQATLRK